ncbi:MAG: hypothetical protein QOF49_962 [Chloroflexota bacterium]|nr:hypothetical protein [Chloroflexota bacterium]
MATKTVVCPECGSSVAPGRYACPDCGSLLAALAITARGWGGAPERAERASADAAAGDGGPAADTSARIATAPLLRPSRAPEPLSAVASGSWSPMAQMPAAPGLEPAIPGDVPMPLAVARTPAGAYLPPSAFLDALDPRHAAGVDVAARSSDPGVDRALTHSGAAGRLLGSLDLAEDTPRTIVAAGAGVAALGFVLPWANVLAGAGLLGGYFTQWGLAGPGHWIVVTLLVTLVGLAIAGAPTARLPVGALAVAAGTLLVGMLWPYLFGFLGRSVGVWVVLAGAVLLVAGGLLDRRDRLVVAGPPVG